MMQREWKVAAAYCFANIADPEALRTELRAFAEPLGLRGTLLIAPEGINGTMAGQGKAIEDWIERLRAIPGCADMDVKWSTASEQPFQRLKIRLKREIVTLGVEDIDPVGNVGEHVDPDDWNALIADPDTILIDTRNDYEVAIGSFEGAIDPETAAFGDFPEWFEARAAQWRSGAKPKKIAMFCTGGIRCEKSTAYVRSRGFDEVYHLKGGILNYLEQVPEASSKWQGDCFVFDERVALTHGLKETGRRLCKECGRPETVCACKGKTSD